MSSLLRRMSMGSHSTHSNSLFYLKTIFFLTPNFYPNPAVVLKAHCSVHPSLSIQTQLIYPKTQCLIQTQLIYSTLIIFIKTPYFLPPIFYPNPAVVLKARCSVNPSLFYPNPAEIPKNSLFIQTQLIYWNEMNWIKDFKSLSFIPSYLQEGLESESCPHY